MAHLLTPGSLAEIYAGKMVDNPVVQVLDLKKLEKQSTGAGNAKLRVVLSDSRHYLIGILSSQVVSAVESGALGKFGVIRLANYSCNDIQGRRVIIILNVDILVGSGSEQFGQPDKLEGPAPSNAASANTAARAPPLVNSSAPSGSFQQQQQSSHPMQMGAQNAGMAMGMNNRPQQQQQQQQPTSYASAASITSSNTGNSFMGAPSSSSSSVGAPAAPAVTPQQQRPNRPIVPAQSPPMTETILPIAALSMYQNRWAIRARVAAKGQIKRYSNQRGEGKLLAVTFVDEHGGEIRATMFNDAVDKFGDLLSVDNVYIVARGQIKQANKKFSTVNNDYELVLDERSHVELVADDGAIPHMKINLTPIAELPMRNEEEVVDVLGVVQSVSDVSEITSKKTGNAVQKRTISIADASGAAVDATLWGASAANCEANVGDVVALKEVRISGFNGRSLNCSASSTLIVEPKMNDAFALRGWFNQNAGFQFRSISTNDRGAMGSGGIAGGAGGNDRSMQNDRRKGLGAIVDEHLGFNDKPDWLSTLATVHSIRSERDMWYFARRAEQREDGSWRYEKCDPSDPSAEKRYAMSMQLIDTTGQTYVTAFDAVAQSVLQGMPAGDLAALKESAPEQYAATIQDSLFKRYVCKLKIQASMVNDERRPRPVLVAAAPVNWADESKRLIQELRQSA